MCEDRKRLSHGRDVIVARGSDDEVYGHRLRASDAAPGQVRPVIICTNGHDATMADMSSRAGAWAGTWQPALLLPSIALQLACAILPAGTS